MSKSYKGFFTPRNIEKYQGNPTQIVFRSLWERAVMKWLDTNDIVVAWSSECVVIPYVSMADKSWHRYFPDFYVKLRTSTGDIKEYLIEIKPDRYTRVPVRPRRQSQRYINEMVEYAKNVSKWEAAQRYCEKKGWTFKILTEKELFGR